MTNTLQGLGKPIAPQPDDAVEQGAESEGALKDGAPSDRIPDAHDSTLMESELARYLTTVGVSPQVHPGVDADAPDIRADGDERYAYGHELGKGGGGRVVLATDRNLRRSVAIKSLLEKRETNPRAVQAFLEEAIVTAGLDHPNIVSIYDLSWKPKLGLYYTMKRLSGTPLRDVLDRLRAADLATRRQFGRVRLLGYFREICMGISYAHARGVIHSDLKPDNVVIGDYGEVVIVDWGLAQLLGEGGKSQARATMRAGTPDYMPPEQILGRGASLTPAADIWALGVMLYELLTLGRPFTGESVPQVFQSVIRGQYVAPSERAPEREISPELDDIVARAINSDIELRYAKVETLVADLDIYLEGVRERQQREQKAQRALAQVATVLAPIQPIEVEVDGLLAKALDNHPPELWERRLGAARERLLDAYAEAAGALSRCLESGCEQFALRHAAGDLYWRIFARLYPSHIRPADGMQERCQRILTSLSRNAMSTIIRVGREQVGELKTEPDNPWLAIAGLFSRGGGAAFAQSEIARVVERIGFLKKVPLFKHMDVWKLMSVSDACEEHVFAAGIQIFNQGQAGTALYMLRKGYVDIVRDGAVINTVGPGDFFGEIAVLGEMPRTASANAVGEVDALVLEASRFRRAVLESGELAFSVVQVLNERLRVATERESALRKLAQTLLAPTNEPLV
ncbi:MAG: serine/threonine-protein kinase [Nannocystaceae bacterium]